jgi:excisionase family DNA binding protein
MDSCDKCGRAGELLTLDEVAEHLRLGKRTTYRMAKEGELPAFKIGGAWRFDRVDIDRWIEEQKAKGGKRVS